VVEGCPEYFSILVITKILLLTITNRYEHKKIQLLRKREERERKDDTID